MARYIAVIDYADGAYGAYFPDAEGCTAMGATEEEVVRNATEALAEWAADAVADGLRLPTPRSYAELLKSRQFDLGKGGLIATIPLILETGKVTRANISIDAGLLTSIDEAAGRLGVTRSAFLAAAARDKIGAS
jgi:predicted RNase H-like HicB family nuclease